jgi:hypothetical protein
LSRVPSPSASRFRRAYPAPPRIHWLWIVVLVGAAEIVVLRWTHPPLRDFLVNLVIAIWPVSICLWLRKVDPQSTSLYWALASFATGFLFSWLLWIVVVFEIREDLLDHFNRREPIGLRLNLVLTSLFSFAYFQYHLRRIALAKDGAAVDFVSAGERSPAR